MVITTKRIILTGEKGVGKTTLCQRLVEQTQKSGIMIGGLISPAIFGAGQKMGIDVVNLRDNRSRRLAYTHEHITEGPNTKRWAFEQEVVEWGNKVLKESTPCDLLIIDELGPLEFECGSGWQNGFTALDHGEYSLALIVIRPKLLSQALARWPDAEIVELMRYREIESSVMRKLHPISFM